MVIDNFYVFRALLRPAETYPVLIVHANAIPPYPGTLQRLQPVSWGCAKIFQSLSRIQLLQLTKRDRGNHPE
jgi:hypothetical protein